MTAADTETAEPVKSKTPIRDALLARLQAIQTSDGPKAEPIADAVFEALERLGTFFRHAEQTGFGACMYFSRSTRRLYGVTTPEFRAWLAHWTHLFAGGSVWKQVCAEVEHRALHRGTPVVPSAYWTRRGDVVYISSGPAEMVRISGDSIDCVPNGTDDVLFLADAVCAPWRLVPEEEQRSPLDALRLFSDAATDTNGRMLLLVYLTALPALGRKKPILALIGPPLSGKTELACAIHRLWIGSGVPRCISVDARKRDDTWLAVDSGGIVTLDNLDAGGVPWLPDMLATVSTGGTSEKRQLYTDRRTVALHPNAAVVLTSSNPDFAGDVGLAGRLLVVRMRARTDTADGELAEEIAQHRDACLTWLVASLRAALADTAATPAVNLRHPDFGVLALRIGRAWGLEAETLAALTAVEADKSLVCLESDPLGALILAHVTETGPLEGKARSILSQLLVADPKLGSLSALQFAKDLQRLWTHLERVCEASSSLDRQKIRIYRIAARR